MKEESEKALQVYRNQIDEIDHEILELMNRRISAAKFVAEIKSALEQPAFYRPEREAQVLRRLKSLNPGPLDDLGVESLFREIMSITRGTEAGLSVAVLGPAGTYTETAARQHFGGSVDVLLCSTIDEIFRTTESGQANFAVVPVENSTEGGVNATLDRLITTSLLICGEVNLEIHHNLMSKASALSDVHRVYAHGQALAQCKRWFDTNVGHAELIAVSSNAEAAKRAASEVNAAAVAGVKAAQLYQLDVLSERIEDEASNTTRFLVLSTRETPPSGRDKTSLLLSCKNKPGALFSMLKPLFDRGVDMTRIESRPSRTGLWEYVFFIDIIGHAEEEVTVLALDELREQAGLYKKLGSYPVAG